MRIENGEWATWFTILHSAPIQQKSHRIIDTVAFIALFLINQLIQLGNMMRAGRGLVLRLLGVQTDHGRGLLDGLHRACTGYTAARACHAFEQITVVLAGLGGHQQLAAVAQTLGVGDLDLAVRVFLVDDVDNGLGYAAGYRKVTAVRGCIVDACGSSLRVSTSIWRAAKMPAISSNVSTKSTSLRTSERIASSFFAAHGR